MNYIIDTCVVSELIKPFPCEAVVEWINQQEEATLYLSVITLGEIQKGISKLPENTKKANLQSWLDTELKWRFGNRVLSVDHVVAKEWGSIQGTSEKSGRKMPVVDCLIAATARVHSMAVVTRNIVDMKIPGLEIINPWDMLQVSTD